jgi:tetratricopeptide (TPR) repeat protein
VNQNRYEVAHFDDFSMGWHRNQTRWAPVRSQFDIEAFGINAYRAEKADEDVISEHDEAGERGAQHQELYFVASGNATFTVEGEEIDAPQGTFVFVRDPAVKRKAVAREPGTLVVAIGGKAGEVFKPSQWERSAPGFRYWPTQEWDKAIEELLKAHEKYPDDGTVLYNLACAEARKGDAQAAVEHLRRSVALNPDMRKLAEDDEDFESIRESPDFKEITAKAAT